MSKANKVKRVNKNGDVVIDKKVPVKGNCSKYRTITLANLKVIDDPKLQLIMHENGSVDHLFNEPSPKSKNKRKRYF